MVYLLILFFCLLLLNKKEDDSKNTTQEKKEDIWSDRFQIAWPIGVMVVLYILLAFLT